MRGRKRETESFSNMHSVYATPHELKPINSKMTKPPTKCYTKLPKRLSFGHVVQLVISLCYLSFQLQSHSKSHLQLWHHAHDDFFFCLSISRLLTIHQYLLNTVYAYGINQCEHCRCYHL